MTNFDAETAGMATASFEIRRVTLECILDGNGHHHDRFLLQHPIQHYKARGTFSHEAGWLDESVPCQRTLSDSVNSQIRLPPDR
jgi:hypothetical protein